MIRRSPNAKDGSYGALQLLLLIHRNHEGPSFVVHSTFVLVHRSLHSDKNTPGLIAGSEIDLRRAKLFLHLVSQLVGLCSPEELSAEQ